MPVIPSDHTAKTFRVFMSVLASIKTSAAFLLKNIGPDLAAFKGEIVVEGHTDNQGATETNLKLSEARAASVVSWLNAHGVAVSRLEPKGFGASRPVADNAAANGRALNRRVEIALAK